MFSLSLVHITYLEKGAGMHCLSYCIKMENLIILEVFKWPVICKVLEMNDETKTCLCS